MANISIKKDFEDGQKLFAQQLNNNFETIELGINAGNKLIWKDDNGAEFQTFRGTTEEIENRPIIDGQTLYNIETGEMLLDTEDSRRTINKPLWNDNSTSEVTSFRGTTEEIENRPIIDGQKLYDIENGDTFLDVGETRKVMNKPLWKDDNGAQVQSFRGTAAEVAARPIIDGQTLYNIETGETALDVGDKRISTGAGNVVYIGDEEPQNDATKIWIENDQVLNLGSEITISPEEPTTQEKVWIQKGKNLFDKNTVANGYRLSSDGKPYAEDSGVFLSDFIEVEPGKTYATNWAVNIMEAVAFYDTNKNFLIRHTEGTSFEVTSAKYMRICGYQNNVATMSVEEGAITPKKIHTKTDNGYEEFYNEKNREVYSTGEQRIGTWIDGKPLYRKVLQGVLDGTYTENGLFYSWISLNVGHLGIVTDLRVSAPSSKAEGRVYTSSGSSSVINCCVSGSAIQVGASIDHFNNQTVANAIIEYTKTTD